MCVTYLQHPKPISIPTTLSQCQNGTGTKSRGKAYSYTAYTYPSLIFSVSSQDLPSSLPVPPPPIYDQPNILIVSIMYDCMHFWFEVMKDECALCIISIIACRTVMEKVSDTVYSLEAPLCPLPTLLTHHTHSTQNSTRSALHTQALKWRG